MIIVTPINDQTPDTGNDHTSGTTEYNPWKNVIERRALRMIGAYASDGEPTSRQIKDCDDVLNMLLKEWTIQGLLWTRVWGTLFLNKGQTQYSLANTNHQNFSPCAFSSVPGQTVYVQSSLVNSIKSGDTSCIIADPTGITNGDFVGIINNAGIIEWFYGAFAEDDTGPTDEILLYSDATMKNPSAMLEDADVGNLIYSFPPRNQICRPTKVMSVVRKLYDPIAANGSEVPLEPNGGISRTDYERLPNKTQQGKVVNYYYDPQLVYGILNVWPTADDPRDKLILSMDRTIQDVLDDTDSFDAPQEAMSAIAYSLAVELEPEYPLNSTAFGNLVSMASAKKQQLINYNRESAPTRFEREWRT